MSADPRIARVRAAVARHLAADDAIGVSEILETAVGWIECHGVPHASNTALVDAVAALVSALRDDDIDRVLITVERQGGLLAEMLAEFAADDAQKAAQAAERVN